LTAKGVTVNDVDRKAFRAALSKTNSYKGWTSKYGDDAWNRLEDAAGKLT